ncbi:MAG: T9SS type A sorting domain-containing protein [Crocinitomicaceae bacterium]|nr:T9SS type A sorting domain-containing protein [Crocinitomicaceae bacterium]
MKSILLFLAVFISVQSSFGQFGQQKRITAIDFQDATVLGDMDNDGDLDVISCNDFSEDIVWFENHNGTFTREEIQVTNTFSSINYIKDIAVGDIDLDGDLDVIGLSGSSSNNILFWYENLGDGVSFTENAILNGPGQVGKIDLIDLDSDADLDIILTSSSGGKIIWIENYGLGFFSQNHLIATGLNFASKSVCIDMDGDLDLDIVTVGMSANKIWYIENLGFGNFEQPAIISDQIIIPASLSIDDLDGDGNLDILVSSGSNNSFYILYNQGNVAFGLPTMLTNLTVNPKASVIEDFDGDSDLDIITISYGDKKLSFYENLGSGNFSPQVIIYDKVGYVNLISGDINSDGKEDVVFSSLEIGISWNLGSGIFTKPEIITSNAPFTYTCDVADINNDGNLDIISADFGTDRVYWFENKGNYIFEGAKVIDDFVNNPGDVFTADLNGDGNQDVLLGTLNQVIWFENLGGEVFGNKQIIASGMNDVRSVYADDLDGDGDLDVLNTSYGNNVVKVYQNDGTGVFTPLTLSNSITKANFVISSDFDNDNDKDVFVSSDWLDAIYVFENLGAFNFGTPVLVTNQLSNPYSLFAGDFDNDGDDDIIAGTDDLYYIENVGGVFLNPLIISPNVSFYVVGIDVDGDSDLDIVASDHSNDKIYWYENNGGAIFSSANVITGNVDTPYHLGIGDLNSNGKMDLVSSSYNDGKIAVYNNNFGCPMDSAHLPTVQICNGTSTYVLDSYLSTSGIYYKTYLSDGGCDSVSYIEIDVIPSYTYFYPEISLCGNDSVNIFGEFHSSNAMYSDTLVAINGCDSIMFQKLIMHPDINNIGLNYYICQGDSMLIFNEYQSNAGIFYDTLQTIYGCDSILSKELFVHPLESSNLGSTQICQNDSVLIFNQYQSNAGVYYDTLQTIYGCDSILSKELIVHPLESNDQGSSQICQNDSIFIFNQYQSIAGLYYDTLQTIYGCDSILFHELIVHPPESNDQGSTQICQNDSILIFNQYHTTAGIYYDTIQTIHGCDSILSQELIVNPLPTVTMDQLAQDTICEYMPPYNLTGTPSGGTFSGPGVSGNVFDPSVANWGEHTLYYTYTDGNGCEAVDSVSIWVNACLEIQNNIFPDLSIYPNPFKDLTTINFGQELNGEYNAVVYDALGNQVYLNEKITGNQIQIHRNELSAGIYIFTLIDHSTGAEVFTTKLMIEN